MGRAETSITKDILKWLNKLPKCYAIKRHISRFGMTGLPDITGCINGKHFELEVKVPPLAKAEVSPAQRLQLLKWADAGAMAQVVCSLGDVKEIFREVGFID